MFVDAAASLLVDTAERLQIVSLLSCRAVWSSSKAAKCYAVHPTRPEFAAAFVEGNWTMVRVFHISRGGNVAQVGAAKWRGSAGQLQALTYVQVCFELKNGRSCEMLLGLTPQFFFSLLAGTITGYSALPCGSGQQTVCRHLQGGSR